MCNSSKTKQHSKYLADDTRIYLPVVTMVLEKEIQNKPMAKGDTSALAIFTRNFIECLERLSFRSSQTLGCYQAAVE